MSNQIIVFGARIFSSARPMFCNSFRLNSHYLGALRLLGSKNLLLDQNSLIESRNCSISRYCLFRHLGYTKENSKTKTSACGNYLINLSVTSRLFHLYKPDCKEISYDEFIKLKKKGLTVIDVRNEDEISQSGTVSGSINIPLQHISKAFGEKGDYFKAKLGRKKPSENQTIMFLCKSGMRSKTAMNTAHKLGYKNSYSFRGGWDQFSKASK